MPKPIIIEEPLNEDNIVNTATFISPTSHGQVAVAEEYNFAAHDRTTVLFGRDGTIYAMARESFSQIDDKKRLREVFAKYQAAGGTVTEQQAFPRTRKASAPKSGRQA